MIQDLHKNGKRIKDRQIANLLLQDKYNDLFMEDNKTVMPYNVYYKAEDPDEYNPMYMYTQEFIRFSILKHYGFTINEYLELSREYQEVLIETIRPSVEREEDEARKRAEELNKLNRGYDGRRP